MTLSLLDLITHLETRLGRPITYAVGPWRPSDQKVYVSRIDRVRSELAWAPRVTPVEGVDRLVQWAQENIRLFEHLRP